MSSCDLEAGLPEVAKALANCNRCRWLKNRLGWQKRCVFTLRDGSTTSWLAANPRGEAFGLYCTVCRKHCPGSVSPYVRGTKGAIVQLGCFTEPEVSDFK